MSPSDAGGRPSHCPRCSSPSPELHPALQSEGEVQPCSHEWHDAAFLPVGFVKNAAGFLVKADAGGRPARSIAERLRARRLPSDGDLRDLCEEACEVLEEQAERIAELEDAGGRPARSALLELIAKWRSEAEQIRAATPTTSGTLRVIFEASMTGLRVCAAQLETALEAAGLAAGDRPQAPLVLVRQLSQLIAWFDNPVDFLDEEQAAALLKQCRTALLAAGDRPSSNMSQDSTLMSNGNSGGNSLELSAKDAPRRDCTAPEFEAAGDRPSAHTLPAYRAYTLWRELVPGPGDELAFWAQGFGAARVYREEDVRRLLDAAGDRPSLEPTTFAVQVLKNYGADVECGACMEVAFTGMTTNEHTCQRERAAAPVLPEPPHAEPVERQVTQQQADDREAYWTAKEVRAACELERLEVKVSALQHEIAQLKGAR